MFGDYVLFAQCRQQTALEKGCTHGIVLLAPRYAHKDARMITLLQHAVARILAALGFSASACAGLVANETLPEEPQARDGSVNDAQHLAVVRPVRAWHLRDVQAVHGVRRPSTCA